MRSPEAEASARYFARLKAEGLCRVCREPAGGGVKCRRCADENNARDRADRAAARRGRNAACYARKRDAGMCVICGRLPARDGRTECASCAEVRRQRYRLKHPHTNISDRRCENCGQVGHFSCSAQPARCRCGLSLPCNSCLLPAHEVGGARVAWE